MCPRIVAMQSLQMFSPADALDAAARIAQDTVPYCRTTAVQTLTRALARTGADALSPELARVVGSAIAVFRDARRRELGDPEPLVRIGALRALAVAGDSSDLVRMREALHASSDTMGAVANVAASVVPGMERRLAPPDPAAGRGGRGGGGRGAARTPVNRPIADYRAIVEKWIVPDYEGKPHPRAEWDTPRGVIGIELFPGDAPLAVDDFVQITTRGLIAGTEFTRVVPDFVNQQQTIRAGGTLRDEVNRRGLVRANVSWASAGLDTGAPGYTLGHTPQPNNEGDFTSIGRVVRGLEAMDRIELGDRVLRARIR